MVMTISAPPAAALTLAAASPPEAASASTCPLLRSKPRTEWPALMRFCAIGNPMLPRPMKPMRAMPRPSRFPAIKPGKRGWPQACAADSCWRLLRLDVGGLGELHGDVRFLRHAGIERLRRHDHLLDAELGKL